MFNRSVFAIALLIAALIGALPAAAQVVVVTSCAAGAPLTAGNTGSLTVDVNGKLCGTVTGSQFSTFTATIANGASLSGAVNLGLNRLFAIVVPSVWTGTTTPITFQASADGINNEELYDSTGTEVQMTVTGVSTFIVNATPAEWLGVGYIKVRSGTASSAVNQGQTTNLIIVGVP